MLVLVFASDSFHSSSNIFIDEFPMICIYARNMQSLNQQIYKQTIYYLPSNLHDHAEPSFKVLFLGCIGGFASFLL